MAVGKKPAEVVVKIIPNTGKRACDDHMDFGKLLSDLINRLELAIGKNPTELVGKFIPDTKDPRVYDTRGLGKMVESILINIHSEKIWCLDGLHLLHEDGNKGEVNRHDNNHREELVGLNIPGDACKLTTHTDEDKENENSNKCEVILVEDEKTGSEHNAIDVIVAKLQDILTNGENTEVDMLIERLTTTKEYTIKELGDLIEKYEVRAPKTNNILSPAYRRNRLYKASKDPIKTSGDMHRDIRINLIDHCRSKLNSGRAKLPYGVLKLYTETTPETVLGEYLFKFDDPKVLEKCLFKYFHPKVLGLVYCVNDSYKPHPARLEVLNLPILMDTTDKQNSEESPKLISLQNAVSEGIVSNHVEYFIVTIYEFYKCIGMSEKLRFKRQCDGKCWVAEIKCSGGWIECTRISVENDAALEAKCDLSQTSFKKNSKKVAQAIEAMSEEEKKKMMADLNSKKEHKYFVGTIQETVTITPDMLPVTKEKNTVYVAAVSWIGRIVCCLYEHAYKTKRGKAGTLLNVFSFPSLVAPYKCFVIENKEYKNATKHIVESLDKARIRYMTATQGNHAWKKLIMSDECGCPFAVRVYSEDSVTIRERDGNRKISVKVDDMGQVIEDLLSGVRTWTDIC